VEITEVKTTPLFVPYAKPYHWAHGDVSGASVILVEVHTDQGIVGYGESIGSPSPQGVEYFIQRAASTCIGRDPFSNAKLMRDAYQELFQALGTCSAPRFSGQVLSGIEMALWDVMGKATGHPAHELLGGAVRDEISYFGFAQGDTPQEVAADAGDLVELGYKVIYFKVGRGDELDLDTTRAVRAAVDPGIRLRVDPNEHWTAVQARRMINQLVDYGVEVVEQPMLCESVAALAQLRGRSVVPISADQSVFTPFDVYDVCRTQAADLIVLGLHETGGLLRLSKAAHIAEAAGVDICLHGLYETGITTCAANQVAATIPNLDDANQHMTRFLAWDVVKSPSLEPRMGQLPILTGPGLGFEIDWTGVDRARHAFLQA